MRGYKVLRIPFESDYTMPSISIKEEIESALRGDSVLGERMGDYMTSVDNTKKLDMDEAPPMYVSVMEMSNPNSDFSDRVADRMGIHLHNDE